MSDPRTKKQAGSHSALYDLVTDLYTITSALKKKKKSICHSLFLLGNKEEWNSITSMELINLAFVGLLLCFNIHPFSKCLLRLNVRIVIAIS